MVERLKIAVAKARAEREQVTPAPAPDPFAALKYEARASEPCADKETPRPAARAVPAPDPVPAPEIQAASAPSPDQTPETPDAAPAPDAAWAALEPVTLDAKHLERNRIITESRSDPAHVAFDVLRTRILRVFAKHGWTRMGITSPTKACGKTFVSANLALSLARQKGCRTILMDLDLRAPSLGKVLGVKDPDPMSWFLAGDVAATGHLQRVGDNLALGLNDKKAPNPAETLLAPQAATALSAMHETLTPDIVIYDLPPMLSCDDVLGFLPQLDCVLLVVGGGTTRPAEVTECERLLADQTHLLGVLLNKGEDAATGRYGYEGG